MTVIEKKKKIKQIIDTIPEASLDEALEIVQELASKEEKRKMILLDLLEREKSLFEKLAQ